MTTRRLSRPMRKSPDRRIDNLPGITIFILLISGWALYAAARPLPFIPESHRSAGAEETNDTLSIIPGYDLEELVIETTGRRQLSRRLSEGSIEILASGLTEMPTIMGGGDALSAIRSLGAIATAADLTASLSIRGLPTGASRYSANGMRLGNPLHLLGLYSVYPPGIFDSYTLSTFPDVALSGNSAGAVIDAKLTSSPDSIFGATATLGLIESHGSFRIPISRDIPTSLTIGARTSYLNQVFPNLLKAGSSTLRYSFTDGAAILRCVPGTADMITLSGSLSTDHLNMLNDQNSHKESASGWSNIAIGAVWNHSKYIFQASFLRYSNKFNIEQGERQISLPTSMSETTLSANRTLGNFRIHIDAILRRASEQHNISGTSASSAPNTISKGIEINAAAGWRKALLQWLEIDAGIRLSAYHSVFKGDNYSNFAPQPRLAVSVTPSDYFRVSLRYARMMRFDILVEESATGMPLNYFLNCRKGIKPADNHSLELEFSGVFPNILIDWQLTAYGIRMLNAAEFGGSLLSFLNYGYSPTDDLHFGRGYSAGLTISMERQFGPLRGRINYNLGFSRLRIPFFSEHYFPASSDRLHDLSINLTWQFLRRFILSGNFTLASGTPYTRARYGYIIGENLICEYYPHNSSRLPLYRRLDLSLSYRLITGKFSHDLTLTLYNALASKNTLFLYNHYSMQSGVEIKKSIMKSVIPSISYTLSF